MFNSGLRRPGSETRRAALEAPTLSHILWHLLLALTGWVAAPQGKTAMRGGGVFGQSGSDSMLFSTYLHYG